MHLLKQRKRRSVGAHKTVSEKLHEQFAPSTVVGGDSDSDEAGPQVAEFDENDDDIERAVGAGLSEIRKRNAQLLDAVDRKYRGQVASRRDLEEDEDGDESEDDEEEDDDSEEDSQVGALLRLKVSQESDDQEGESEGSGSDGEDGESEDDEDDDDDFEDQDFSLGDFLGSTPSDSQKLIADENRQEAVQKGTCVQNQLKMWERLLEMRIKMQTCLVTANSLPHEDKFSSLSKNDQFKEASQKVVQTVESTLKNLLELQSTLIANFPETKELGKPGTKRKLKESKSSSSKHSRLADYESLLSDSFTSYKPYRNDVIQKWHDRTKAASSGTKNIHQSLSVVKKIENALLTKDELIRKTQLFRGGYELFQKPASKSIQEPVAKDAPNTAAEPEQVYDGEIFDDSDFYHALLRELIEYKSNTTENPQQIGAKLAELQKLRSKMKKQVDTRASKGRKIRYVVHKKLVNFTAPEPSNAWTEEAKNELFMSLFGGTSSANGGGGE